MSEHYEDLAIETTIDLLIDLLRKRDFCKAKRIGIALEVLVEEQIRTTKKEAGIQSAKKD